MHDVQAEDDGRNIRIDRVGVRRVKFPLNVVARGGGLRPTVAEVDLAVELPQKWRGTHMSRLVEVMTSYRERLWLDTMGDLLDDLRSRLDARASFARVEFPFFIDKAAPVTGAVGPLAYRCALGGESVEGRVDLTLEVVVPVTTLCPCSQAMADRGAHNQRGAIKTVVRFHGPLFIEDLVELVEACGSCGVYSVLKRPDEKWVTEHAYARPRFVEDVVRDVAVALGERPDVTWFAIEAESHESIHDHDAYAFVKRDKRECGGGER